MSHIYFKTLRYETNRDLRSEGAILDEHSNDKNICNESDEKNWEINRNQEDILRVMVQIMVIPSKFFQNVIDAHVSVVKRCGVHFKPNVPHF